MSELEENSVCENGINPNFNGRQYHIEEVAEWAFLKSHRALRDDDVDLINDADQIKTKTQEYLRKAYNYDEGSFELTGKTLLSDEQAYINILMERKRIARERPADKKLHGYADEIVDYVEEIIPDEIQDGVVLKDDIWGVKLEEMERR